MGEKSYHFSCIFSIKLDFFSYICWSFCEENEFVLKHLCAALMSLNRVELLSRRYRRHYQSMFNPDQRMPQTLPPPQILQSAQEATQLLPNPKQGVLYMGKPRQVCLSSSLNHLGSVSSLGSNVSPPPPPNE